MNQFPKTSIEFPKDDYMNRKDVRKGFNARVTELVDDYWDCRDLSVNDNTEDYWFFNSPKKG